VNSDEAIGVVQVGRHAFQAGDGAGVDDDRSARLKEGTSYTTTDYSDSANDPACFVRERHFVVWFEERWLSVL